MSDQAEMTSAQRLNYLRERGILVETAEDRRRQKVKDIMNEPDVVDGEEYEELKFVHIPHDETIPIRELTTKVSKNRLAANAGDLLLVDLKPYFSALSKKVDLNLFKDQATKHFGSSDAPQVSEEALRNVAEQGQVESFSLVYPTESNNFTSVNIYLDEVGMLKKLPLNKRAADLAAQAGFNPPPSFYGDVFIGRIKNKPIVHNVDFTKKDTTSNTKWLQGATMGNLEHQTAMNQITGSNNLQPDVDGENGIAKLEDGYTWTQTEEEIEIIIPLTSKNDAKAALNTKEVKAAGLKVNYFPKRMKVEFRGDILLALDYFANVDPDGCTWTLDSTEKGTFLVVTCEKVDGISWPRITNK